MDFGQYIKAFREAKRATDPSFSLRQVAQRVGVDPGYLSKLELGRFNDPSEKVVLAIAQDLGASPDLLLAMTGRVSATFKKALMKRPELFIRLLAEIKDLPDQELVEIQQRVRDGNW